MGRYLDVIKASLTAERGQPKTPDRLPVEREFLPAAIELLETPASPAGRVIGGLLILFFVVAAVWATVGKVDNQATAMGRIIPTGNVKIIQPFETGTVRAINVKNNDIVGAGDLLIELDTTDAAADRDRLARDLMTARIEAARLKAAMAAAVDGIDPEIAFAPPTDADPALVRRQLDVLMNGAAAHRATLASIDAQIMQIEAQKDRVAASLEKREQVVAVIGEQVTARMDLLEKEVVSRASYLQAAQALYEEQEVLISQQGSLVEMDAGIEALRRRRLETGAAYLAERTAELAQTEKLIATLAQELIKAVKRNQRNQLRAPVAGTVQQLSVHTIGAVVTTGDPLMIVVPGDSGLEVEAMLLNKDKGFVSAGQDAEIKLEAFTFTKYGTIPGTVLHVSNDAVDHEVLGLVFPMRVSMDRETIRAEGKVVALTPGMAATVEVKTGRRRVIEFLLTPLLRYRDEALRER